MTDEIRLTKAIHYFVRGELNWMESLELLDVIVDSSEWLMFLETEILLYEIACSDQECHRWSSGDIFGETD